LKEDTICPLSFNTFLLHIQHFAADGMFHFHRFAREADHAKFHPMLNTTLTSSVNIVACIASICTVSVCS
jgi:hypothetical protein